MIFARGVKVRSAVWLSGFIWIVVFIIAAIVTISPVEDGYNPVYLGPGGIPWLLLFCAAGFLLLSFVLWLPMFVIDTIRHAIARAGSHDV